MILKINGSFYTVKFQHYERHFLTLWELIAFLASINLEAQKN